MSDDTPVQNVKAQHRVETVFPLTPMQQGMFFHGSNDPGKGLYVEQIRLSLRGLDVPLFRQAWDLVASQRPALRTSIAGGGLREPAQVVRRSVELEWQELDWSGLEPGERAERLQAFLEQDRLREFGFSAPSLVRMALMDLGAGCFEFVWTLHHIVLDGWSGALLLDDVFTAYAALQRGEHPELPARRPFSEFVRWLREVDPEQAEAYWKRALDGFDEPSFLALRQAPEALGPRQAEGSAGDYATYGLQLSEQATLAVATAAKSARVTPNTVCRGAWALVVAAHTGSRDVLFGSVVSGRPEELEDVESMVGMFVNTLPTRLRLRADESFNAWLSGLQREDAEARTHQTLPLWRVQELGELGAGAPLFDCLFAFENYRAPQTQRIGAGAGLEVEFHPPLDRTGYPLLVLLEPGERMALRLTYETERFERAEIEALGARFCALLEAVGAAPEARLSELLAPSPEERARLLQTWSRADWGRSESALPEDGAATLHALFAAQVKRTPEAPALIFGDAHGEQRTLTYGELGGRVNQLAHFLRERLDSSGAASSPGSRDGDQALVGVCFERSPEMIVAVLGVLTAGACYVPLDPRHPEQRRNQIVERAGLALVLLHTQTATLRPELEDRVAVVDLDLEASRLAAGPQGALPESQESERAQGASLAYVLHTSGSTGVPKGVAMPHAPLVDLMRWQASNSAANAALGRGDRTLQFAPLSFDVSCQEIFATLSTGGALCLVDDATRRDPEALLGLLAERSIARICVPFVALQQLAEAASLAGAPDLPALREVITAGEQLQASTALRAFFERHPGCRLVNQYGPTECHVVSAYVLSKTPRDWPALPPIGKPVAQARLYVLDDALEPVAVGVPGDLYVGGTALARGYLNDEQQTQERFLADPFSEVGPESAGEEPRMYRTGDRARWLPDGNLAFLGRADAQVKIHGFRVELGEIETALSDHPGVREAVVVVRQDTGDRRLVAYYVTAPESPAVSDTRLRDWLAERLPGYMLPAACVELDELPLLPSGKVDRRALLAEPLAPSAWRAQHVPPRNAVEELLAEIWAEVLGQGAPGVHDDFFDVGGHSLLALQLVVRVRAALRVELPIRALFEHPTIAELAAHVSASDQAREDVPLAAPVASLSAAAAPLSPGQQRMWVLNEAGAGAAYNMPLAFRLQGTLDRDALDSSLGALIARHATLRTRYTSERGRPQQIVEPPSERFELPYSDLRELPAGEREAELERLTRAEVETPFDLARGPVFRPRLVQLADDEHALFLCIHHIAFDGWSAQVLYRELAALYDAAVRGAACVLPELPIQYTDYARWQLERLQTPWAERGLAFWREALAGPTRLELPYDRPRPPLQTFAADALPIELSSDLTQGLRRVARRAGVTLSTALLAAFKCLLARVSGESDVMVGVPTANRGVREVEGLVGFFVNTLPLRTRFPADATFREVLAAVQTTSLAAYEHQELPLERIVEVAEAERDQSRNPLFDVLFVMQNAHASDLAQAAGAELGLPQLAGLEARALRSEARLTPLDLELHMAETERGLSGGFSFNTDLFDRATVARLAQSFCTLLEGALAHPDRKLSELPLLTEGEQQRLLVEFNRTQRPYPSERTLHELILEQVARTPQAVAVAFEDAQLTYAELEQRARVLAAELRGQGVGPDVCVGLCLSPGTDVSVGLLGILLAGGAFVPLDPTFPEERLRFMLEDTGARCLVTESARLEDLPEFDGALVLMDSLGATPRTASEPGQAAGPDDLAWVMYTSGSTGKPKGVPITHRSVVNNLSSMLAQPGLRSDDIVLAATTLSFDPASLEQLMPLLVGARIEVVSREVAADGARLLAQLESSGATFLQGTPSRWQMLLDAGWKGSPRLKMLCGGESLSRSLAEELLARGTELWNIYGPTETTVWSAVGRVESEEPQSAGLTPVSIGGPIANMRYYVVDSSLQLVPVGVRGELLIGGLGLARGGYLQRPELTAAAFIDSPWPDIDPGPLYRSGDIVRADTEGRYYYIGRSDHQVKLRGQRIELGEIESVLGSHADVRRAVALVRDDEHGQRLVAFVQAENGAELETRELRTWLRRELPDYMVPGTFAMLAEIPLSPTGKVDRKRLAALEIDAAGDEAQASTAPRTPTEELVAATFCEVLAREQVGLKDDFFGLGGHSLLAMQVIARLREALGLELDLRQFFTSPSVAELAFELDRLSAEGAPAGAAAAGRDEREEGEL